MDQGRKWTMEWSIPLVVGSRIECVFPTFEAHLRFSRIRPFQLAGSVDWTNRVGASRKLNSDRETTEKFRKRTAIASPVCNLLSLATERFHRQHGCPTTATSLNRFPSKKPVPNHREEHFARSQDASFETLELHSWPGLYYSLLAWNYSRCCSVFH